VRSSSRDEHVARPSIGGGQFFGVHKMEARRLRIKAKAEQVQTIFSGNISRLASPFCQVPL
jgi:hypothetical protein